MNEIKIPSIEFVRLKKGITEEELYDYMAENDDGGFLVYLRYKYDFEKEWDYSIECASYDCCRDAVCWLNDWYEGQQNVEFLAISKLGEDMTAKEMFKALNWYYFKYKVDDKVVEVSGMELHPNKRYFYPHYIRFDLVRKSMHIETSDRDVSLDELKAIQQQLKELW